MCVCVCRVCFVCVCINVFSVCVIKVCVFMYCVRVIMYVVCLFMYLACIYCVCSVCIHVLVHVPIVCVHVLIVRVHVLIVCVPPAPTLSSMARVCAADTQKRARASVMGVAGKPTTTTPIFLASMALENALQREREDFFSPRLFSLAPPTH